MFGFTFWFVVGIATIAIIACVEFSRPGIATLIVLATIALFSILGDSSLVATLSGMLSFIKTNPAKCVVYVLEFIAIGVVWSIFKYWLYVRDKKLEFSAAKKTFMENHTEDEWIASLANGGTYYSADRYKPNMDKITIWMFYWIPSMIWFIINDPVKRFLNWLYTNIVGVYDRIHRAVLGDMITDGEKAKQYAHEHSGRRTD